MAEEVGGIVYEVGMDVKGLQSGGATVNKVLQDIEKSIDDSIAGINKLDAGLKNTGETAVKAGRNLSGLNNAMRQGGYQIQDFIVQVQGGQSALVALSQQGGQLLGVFGSGGAVAGALLTIGTVIVGSLIAGMDNAAVSTKALTAAQQRLADIFQVSSNGVVVLSDKFAKLAEVSENAARAQLTMALIDANNIIKASVQGVNELGDALGTWKAPLSAAISQMDALKSRGMDVNQALKELGGTYEGNIVGLNQLNQVVGEVSKAFGISSDDAVKLVQALADVRQNANPETIAALRDVTVDLSQKYGYANKALSEFTGKVGEYSIKSDQAAESTRLATEMLNGHKVASEEDARATEENTKRLQSYIQSIKDEGATIAFTARQKALYRAEQMGANDADKQEINASFDKIEAYKQQVAQQKEQQKETKKAATVAASAAKQQDSISQKLEQLRQKAMLAANSTQELSRSQAILNAEQSLGKGATQDQIKLAGEYAAKIWDTGNALKNQAQQEQANKAATQVQAQAKTSVNPLTGEAIDPLASINLEEAQKLELYQSYYQQGLINKQTYEDTKTAIEQMAANERNQIAQDENDKQAQNMSQLLGATSSFFGEMAGAVGDYAGESSTAYKALFAVSKGFAIAQASMNLITAISNASALPWPANIPAIAFAAAQGANLIAQVRGASYGGGRKNGGPMSAGSMYEVGEGGLPEIFQASNGRQYMVPGNNGQMFSNKDVTSGSGSSGGGLVVYNTVTNNATNASVSTSAIQNGDGSVTISTIVDDIQSGGQISQAISNTFDTQRKANE